MARVVEVQKVSSASGVGNGKLMWEWATVGLVVVAYIVATMISGTGSIRPNLSRYSFFVCDTAAHVVAACCVTFGAIAREQAALTGVVDGDIIAACPTIDGVVEFACCAVSVTAAATSIAGDPISAL